MSDVIPGGGAGAAVASVTQAGTALGGGDGVTVVIDGKAIADLENISVTRSLEQMPSSFSIQITEPYPNESWLSYAAPGAPISILLGADPVLTGYVNRYQIGVTPGSHRVTITGRSKSQDFVDCSADLLNAGLSGGQMSGVNAFDIAKRLAAPFGLTVKLLASDAGPRIPLFPVALGETGYEITERVCQYARLLIYDDTDGSIVMDQLGDQNMASGFRLGGDDANVEAASGGVADDERFNSYTVLYSSVAQFSDVSALANMRATVIDPTMKRNRPKIIISAQFVPGKDVAQATAEWEFARRIGRSQSISLTCDSWRDSGGRLWQVNALAPLDLPAAKLSGRSWVIGTVTFRKDQGGTHADLVLMPREAFLPQPSILQPYDAEIARLAGQMPDITQP